MRIVIGTSGETMVSTPPVTPTNPIVRATETPSVMMNANRARNER